MGSAAWVVDLDSTTGGTGLSVDGIGSAMRQAAPPGRFGLSCQSMSSRATPPAPRLQRADCLAEFEHASAGEAAAENPTMRIPGRVLRSRGATVSMRKNLRLVMPQDNGSGSRSARQPLPRHKSFVSFASSAPSPAQGQTLLRPQGSVRRPRPAGVGLRQPLLEQNGKPVVHAEDGRRP